MKYLVIVESPAKAKTLSGFLGSDYRVLASVGHIRDLPKRTLGITIGDDESFTPEYVISDDHKKIVSDLKAAAKGAKTIYLATDEDREGEAIAFHIAKALGKDELELPRIVFHEITKSAILEAIKNPRQLDMHSVNAQQARRLLDRIVGYKLSPLLSLKIQKGLSAGRVQSAALKIVVDKEREIQAFVPVKFFTFDMLFKKDLNADLVELCGKKMDRLSLQSEEYAKEKFELVKKEDFAVSKIEEKDKKVSPPAPFMTSTLQQSASTKFGFGPIKTMTLAQKLYEGTFIPGFGTTGLITYMRTDSLNLSKEAIAAAREHIKKHFGKDYLPAKPNIYTSKSKGAQEAHEAIRVTNLEITPQIAAQALSRDEARLYELIYQRFLACQMMPALYQTQNVFVKSKSSTFKISGRKIIFPGFYAAGQESDKDLILPSLELNQAMSVQKLELKTEFTQPPARYSQASLIKQLETLGIGRPSTYAPTISLLEARKYVMLDKKQLSPSETGFLIVEFLEKNFPDIVDSGFTSKMEEDLDQVAEAKASWQEILAKFYFPFIRNVDLGRKNIPSQKVAIKIGESCPQCGSELLIRKGKFGEFVACSAFPKCKYSRNVEGKGGDKPEKAAKEVMGVPCPKCGSDMIKRLSRRGAFWGCSNYPNCKFLCNHRLSEDSCSDCGGVQEVRELKSGIFLACLDCKKKRAL